MIDHKATQIWYGSLPKGQQDRTGLIYRRNRYYDSQTGQFTQDDPIGIAGGVNLYGYANGDPVSYSDPFGLCPIPTLCGALVGGAIGAGVGAGGMVLFNYLNERPLTDDVSTAALAGGVAGALIGAGVGWMGRSTSQATGSTIARMSVPRTPGGISQREFGESVMKWGKGNEAARGRIESLTRGELEGHGVTRQIAESWREFYRNEMLRNPRNPSAAGRAELMQRAAELLK